MSAVSEITENAAVRLEEMPCEEQLVSELSSITDAQVVNLLGVRYRPILINLHSILHRELPPDRIRELAVSLTKAAVWSENGYATLFALPARRGFNTAWMAGMAICFAVSRATAEDYCSAHSVTACTAFCRWRLPHAVSK